MRGRLTSVLGCVRQPLAVACSCSSFSCRLPFAGGGMHAPLTSGWGRGPFHVTPYVVGGHIHCSHAWEEGDAISCWFDPGSRLVEFRWVVGEACVACLLDRRSYHCHSLASQAASNGLRLLIACLIILWCTYLHCAMAELHGSMAGSAMLLAFACVVGCRAPGLPVKSELSARSIAD